MSTGDQRILCVDPGKKTGWGFLDVLVTETGYYCDFRGGELGHDDFLDFAAVILSDASAVDPTSAGGRTVGTIDLVIVEGFTVGPRTIQQCPDDRSLWSVKQIGTLEMFARWWPTPVKRQLPADKGFASDDFLKRLGWWNPLPGVTGEQGHRRDAARHALKYAVDHQIIDLRSLLA